RRHRPLAVHRRRADHTGHPEACPGPRSRRATGAPSREPVGPPHPGRGLAADAAGATRLHRTPRAALTTPGRADEPIDPTGLPGPTTERQPVTTPCRARRGTARMET